MKKLTHIFFLGFGTPTCDCDDIHMDRFEKPPCTLYSLKASYVMVIFRSYDLLTFLLLIHLNIFLCFVNVTIITKPPGFVVVITIFEGKLNKIMYKVCNVD